jgi:hypothetical protein
MITNDDNITVVGAKSTPVAEAKPNELITKEAGASPIDQTKNQGADNITVVGAKPNETPIVKKEEGAAEVKLDTKKDLKENSKSESDKTADKEDKQNAFAVSFGEKEKEEAGASEVVEKKQEAVSMSEESVMQFLKKEYGDAFAEVNSISEISKKEVLADPVRAFQKYHKETGRGVKDFYNLQKDWTEEDQNTTLKEYYLMTNEGLSESDINDQMELIVVTDDYELEHSDEDVKRRKLEFKKEYNKALKYLDAKSKEYKTPLGNEGGATNQTQQLTEAQKAEAYKPYWAARDKSLAELESFDFSIGIGDVKLPITKEHKELIAKKTQTETSFFDDWTDKNGSIDTKKSVEDTAWSIPSIRKHLLAEAAQQIHAISIETDSKKKRNVNLETIKEKAPEVKKRGVQIFGGESSTQMGQPLISN